MDSFLLINDATVFVPHNIGDDRYEFQKDTQGSYTDWANSWNNSGKSNSPVHKLKWEFEGSFKLDLKTVSLKVSTEAISVPLNLEDNSSILIYSEPEIINETTPNASYSSFYFSLWCLHNVGALDNNIFNYFYNKVFYPDFANGFFYPDETLFCECEEGTEEYFQNHFCEQIFNELVARDYLRFYRPKINQQSIKIQYSASCTQPYTHVETLTKDFGEFINAGYQLAVLNYFPINSGKEILDSLSIDTKQWLDNISKRFKRRPTRRR